MSDKNWFNKVSDNIFPNQWPQHKVFIPKTIKGFLALIIYFASFVLLDIFFQDPSTLIKIIQLILSAVIVVVFYYFVDSKSNN